MLGVWLAVDRPILILGFGPPDVVRVTLASASARWVNGMLTFGGATLAGAVLARTIPLRSIVSRENGDVDAARPPLWMAAVAGGLIAATMIGRYAADVVAPVHYTVGVVTLRSRMTTWFVVTAIVAPAAYAAFRYGRALTGFVVGLAAGYLGGIMSSVGVTALLLMARDPIHARWANGRALGPFGDALLVVWTATAIASAVGGLLGRYVLRPLGRRP